ncbi:MAG: hypothetical protein JAY94_04400 [Candidatus Thiodiazotropha endolucinida]|nr:hypothetical protein [Candidatus Thiodiazotropha taylori]MCW4316731.1 hypothetical protein [Candidatus Thiodiazotropha taylori]
MPGEGSNRVLYREFELLEEPGLLELRSRAILEKARQEGRGLTLLEVQQVKIAERLSMQLWRRIVFYCLSHRTWYFTGK